MLLLLLIIAHLLADFYLQTDEMVREKQKHLKKHVLHHFTLYFAVLGLFWFYGSPGKGVLETWLWPALFLTGTHFIIDYMKIKLVDTFSKVGNLYKLSYFIIDQILHLATIVITCQLFYGIKARSVFNRLMELVTVEGATMDTMSELLFIFVILIFGTTVSGHIIRILLGSLPGQLLSFEGKYTFQNNLKEDIYPEEGYGDRGLSEEYSYMIFNKHDLSRGKLIGYIERLLVILLTFYHAYPAIAFIVTAKSIARFKQLDDRDWAEYFLLGTLTSMFLGLAFGILLREILV